MPGEGICAVSLDMEILTRGGEGVGPVMIDMEETGGGGEYRNS